jgi:hypothetical protein
MASERMIHEETEGQSMEYWHPCHEVASCISKLEVEFLITLVYRHYSVEILASVTRGLATCIRYVRVFGAQSGQ